MTRLVCITLVLTAGSVLAQTREPPVIYLPPIVPPGLKLLAQPAVQADVSLTAGQKAEVLALNHLWGLSPHTWEDVWVTPDMARGLIARRTEEFLTKNLTKEQRTRLDQIVFQLREKEFGAHAAFAMAARDLDLRADQLEDVQNLKGLRVEEIVRHVTSGERYEKIKDKVAATNGETFEKMAEMLTRAQRERLKELRGKPFAGMIESIPAGKKVPLPKDVGTVLARDLFGLYEFELGYLSELGGFVGLTPGQHEGLEAELRKWQDDYMYLGRAPFSDFARLQDRTARALDRLLDDSQRHQFDLLMMQRRNAVGGLTAMCGYPNAAKYLKLTPAQLKLLKDGKPASDVLTKEQLKAAGNIPAYPLVGLNWDPIAKHIDNLKGPKAADRNRDIPFGRNFLWIADRIRLSEDQIKKLRELAQDEPKIKDLIRRELSLSETPPFAGATRNLTVDRAVMDKYQAAVEEQCWSVLDAQQQSLARKIFGRGGR